MNRVLIHRKSSLVFRQWTRKNYAVFASLGKEVQIGHIDDGISEKAIDKNKTKKSLKKDWNSSVIIETEDPNELLLVNTDLLLISLISEITNSDESSQRCCKSIFTYNFRNVTIHPVFQDAKPY